MGISRRTAMIGGAALAIGAASFGMLTHTFESQAKAILSDHFGTDIANSDETAAYIKEIATFWKDANSPRNQFLRPKYWALAPLFPGARAERASLEEQVVIMFIRSSNVIRAVEAGEDLTYLGSPNPYENPCANPLGSMWL